MNRPVESLSYCTTILWDLRATTTHKITTSEPQQGHPSEGSSLFDSSSAGASPLLSADVLSASDIGASFFKERGFPFGMAGGGVAAGAEQMVNVPTSTRAFAVASIPDIPAQALRGRAWPAFVTMRLLLVTFRSHVKLPE